MVGELRLYILWNVSRVSQVSESVLVVCSKTSFTFLCSKDFLRITDGMGKTLGEYCGNMTSKNLLVTGDQVKILFKSDDKVEQRGYWLVFTLVSSHGKWKH